MENSAYYHNNTFSPPPPNYHPYSQPFNAPPPFQQPYPHHYPPSPSFSQFDPSYPPYAQQTNPSYSSPSPQQQFNTSHPPPPFSNFSNYNTNYSNYNIPPFPFPLQNVENVQKYLLNPTRSNSVEAMGGTSEETTNIKQAKKTTRKKKLQKEPLETKKNSPSPSSPSPSHHIIPEINDNINISHSTSKDREINDIVETNTKPAEPEEKPLKKEPDVKTENFIKKIVECNFGDQLESDMRFIINLSATVK